jgi:thioredoxin reductase
MESASQPPFDVTIVGGGPAGLAAALVLGRMRRRVLLLDADDPAHGVSDGVHGLFGHDGTPPFELRRTAREQLRPYESVTIRTVAVEEARLTPSGFSVLAGGIASEAGVLVLATGMRYELPPIEGVGEVWARGAYHCPYCHGWEVRDQPLAAYGAGAAHLALLLTSLSDDVVLLTDGSSDLDPDEAEHLRHAGRVRRRLDRRSHRALLHAELHTEPASRTARMRAR